MNVRKTISMVTASAVLMGSFAGCSLLGGKDKAAVTEVVEGYVDAIKAGKYNKSADFVLDGEDYFQDEAFDGVTQELLDAVFAAGEYEVDEVSVDKDSATAVVVFTLPDIDSIADEGYSLDEFIDAVADIDDTVEEEFEFELSKDGDEWFIEGDSTADYAEFLAGLVDDLEFGLSEAGALAAVDEFYSYVAAGNLEAAINMTAGADGSFAEFEAMVEENPDLAVITDIIANYFTAVDYQTEVVSATEDAVTVSVTGTAPDAEAAVAEAVNDHDVMVPIMADVIESYLNEGVPDEMAAVAAIFGVVVDSIGTGAPIPYSTEIVVTADEDGNYYCDPGEGFIFDFDFPDVASSDELLPEALDLLLEQGRITQEQYSMFYGTYGGSVEADVTDVVMEEGDDFYSYNYNVTSNGINLTVVTWYYYDEGSTVDYDIYYNGVECMNGTYVMPDDNEDHIEIFVPSIDGSAPEGTYEVVVYDVDSSSSVLFDVQFIFLEAGASVDASVFGSGESLSCLEISDDFYRFYFLDGNGNTIDSPEGTAYSGNRGAVDFYARTWAYYPDGETMVCEVYCDGVLVGTMEEAADNYATDTFYFTYEPAGGLDDGDYTFVMYDVDNPGSVFAVAYATVES